MGSVNGACCLNTPRASFVPFIRFLITLVPLSLSSLALMSTRKFNPLSSISPSTFDVLIQAAAVSPPTTPLPAIPVLGAHPRKVHSSSTRPKKRVDPYHPPAFPIIPVPERPRPAVPKATPAVVVDLTRSRGDSAPLSSSSSSSPVSPPPEAPPSNSSGGIDFMDPNNPTTFDEFKADLEMFNYADQIADHRVRGIFSTIATLRLRNPRDLKGGTFDTRRYMPRIYKTVTGVADVAERVAQLAENIKPDCTPYSPTLQSVMILEALVCRVKRLAQMVARLGHKRGYMPFVFIAVWMLLRVIEDEIAKVDQ